MRFVGIISGLTYDHSNDVLEGFMVVLSFENINIVGLSNKSVPACRYKPKN